MGKRMGKVCPERSFFLVAVLSCLYLSYSQAGFVPVSGFVFSCWLSKCFCGAAASPEAFWDLQMKAEVAAELLKAVGWRLGLGALKAGCEL